MLELYTLAGYLYVFEEYELCYEICCLCDYIIFNGDYDIWDIVVRLRVLKIAILRRNGDEAQAQNIIAILREHEAPMENYERNWAFISNRASSEFADMYIEDLIFKKDVNGMGKQINYYMGYNEFKMLAEQAIKSGCTIVKEENGKYVRGNSVEIITQDCNWYYFYLPEAGDLEVQMNGDYKFIGGYNSSGNVVIEASYSIVNHEEKKIHRARLFSITGYDDKNGNWIGRPECIKKLYDKLVRTVKKLAPYTEFVDEIQVRCPTSEDYMKTRERKHKEYITKELLSLKENDDYKIGI